VKLSLVVTFAFATTWSLLEQKQSLSFIIWALAVECRASKRSICPSIAVRSRLSVPQQRCSVKKLHFGNVPVGIAAFAVMLMLSPSVTGVCCRTRECLRLETTLVLQPQLNRYWSRNSHCSLSSVPWQSERSFQADVCPGIAVRSCSVCPNRLFSVKTHFGNVPSVRLRLQLCWMFCHPEVTGRWLQDRDWLRWSNVLVIFFFFFLCNHIDRYWSRNSHCSLYICCLGSEM